MWSRVVWYTRTHLRFGETCHFRHTRRRVTDDQDSTLHGVTSVKQTFTVTLTAHTWTKLLCEYGWNNWLQLQPQVCRSCRHVTEHLLYSLRGKDNLIRGISGYVRHQTTTTTTFCLFVFGATAPQWTMASSFTRFLDHTQRRTTIGRTPLDEWSARRRDLYLTTLTTAKYPCLKWDSNPQSQQASGRRPTP